MRQVQEPNIGPGTEGPSRHRIVVLHFADIINRGDFIDNVIRHLNPLHFSAMASVLSGRGTLGAHADSVPVLNLRAPSRALYLQAILRLRRLLRHERPDVLHVHHYEPAVIAAVATSGLCVSLVVGRHYSDAVYRLSGGFRRRAYLGVEAWVNRRAERIVAPSRAVEAVLLSQGVSAEKVVRIPYPFDFQRFDGPDPETPDELASEWPAGPGVRLGTFARLHREKGHRILLRAIQALKQEGFPVRLLIVGDGPDRAPLVTEVENLGIAGQVRFAGWRTDVFRLMRACDIIVQPTLHEAFSQVMVEAMALGRPLVISRVSGVEDVVEDGVSGVVVPPGDVAALSLAIRGTSRPDAVTLGRAAAERVRLLLSVERVVPEYERMYQNLVITRVGRLSSQQLRRGRPPC